MPQSKSYVRSTKKRSPTPAIVGLAIGTRPDCVEDDVLDLIEELAERTYVSVEYGMQTMHDRSLKWMNRGCTHEAMVDAVARSCDRGFEICAHIMLGLPGESLAGHAGHRPRSRPA